MKHKVFVDGSEGTTGLRIYERFQSRTDIELLIIDPKLRKDPAERAKLINQSDITFLCLPDDAARESVALVENERVTIIDTSTAHRTMPGWSYGFPELSSQHRKAIISGKRIAVPGCYATGVIALIYPLIKAGILSSDHLAAIHAISGYSGAGKKMIAEYENSDRAPQYNAPRLYALGQQHKHLKEIQQITGLTNTPIFSPIIADYYQGMVVSIPLFSSQLRSKTTPRELADFFADTYAGKNFIRVMPSYDDETSSKFLCCNESAGWDGLNIYPTGNDDRIVLSAQFDNLGKGASGAAIQCMNLALGCAEDTGLVL
ncbi:MAG: N-acetyl-gamma-glutamyl-phosphate reductase [Lachnospiraceae bacterium]|nr:N-acetyl-gamma-glutamyl-phosphate reductase [Lachnospiraceae bacterium]